MIAQRILAQQIPALRLFLFLSLAAAALPARIAPQTANPPEGRYVLPADGRLFPHDIVLDFFTETGDEGAELPRALLAARIAGLPGIENPAATKCTGCPGPAANQPLPGLRMISGLRYERGEYVLGRIVVPSARAGYRCKLWQRGDVLYLRIYEAHHYSTHQLRPAAPE